MAKNRQVSTKFWSDPFVMDLTCEEKLLFLYLLTNDQVNLSGIYEIDVRLVVFQVGIEKEKILSILEKFHRSNKIAMVNGWVAIKNFQKYQNTRNISIQEGIKRSLEEAPKELVDWVENNTIIQQKENVADERGTSGIREGYERGTTACTLLNSTLLNLTLPNSTLLVPEIEQKEEEVEELQKTKKSTGISFASFEEAIENKNEVYKFITERCRASYKFDAYIIERELLKFYEYWNEKSPTAKKHRWQKEDSFEINRRLSTWFGRVKLTEQDKQDIEDARTKRILAYNKTLLDNNTQNE